MMNSKVFFIIFICVQMFENAQFNPLDYGSIATAYIDASIDNLKPLFDKFVYSSSDYYNSTKCFDQFKYFKAEIERSELWALKVIDSWSKPPAGIASLNIQDLGNFDQCLAIVKDSHEPHIGKWKSQYCLTPILPIINEENILVKTLKNGGTNFTRNDVLKFLPTILMAVCIPDTCSPQLWSTIVNKLLEPVHFQNGPQIDQLCQTSKKLPMNHLDIIAISFFLSVVIIITISTAYEIICLKAVKEPYPILTCFSIYSNSKSIFRISTKKSDTQIECLNGIRSMTIMWIILGHTYAMKTKLPHINWTTAGYWYKTPYATLMIHSLYTCDTFLLLSGFVVCWCLMRELERHNGKINLFLLIISRYLRLTPALIASVFFTLTLFKYIGSGPLWIFIKNSREQPCTENWPKTFTYLQNYLDGQHSCPEESWYLAVDFQLFVISIFIIWGIWRWGKKIIWIIGVPIIFSSAWTYWMVIQENFTLSSMNHTKIYLYIDYIFYATHTRMAPYFIGIALALFLHFKKNDKVCLSTGTVIIAWIISNIFFLIGYYAIFEMIHYPENDTLIKSGLYQTFLRIIWTCNIAWIIFACHYGYAGFINTFLSYRMWQPFARLSYCIYVIHLSVITYFIARTQTNSYFDDIFLLHDFMGYLGCIIIVAIIWSLAFELPVMKLENILLKKKNYADKKEHNELTFTGNLVKKI